MKVAMNLLLWTAGASEAEFPLFKNIKDWGFDGVELPMFDTAGSPWGELSKNLEDLGLGRNVVACLPPGSNLIGEEAGERKLARTTRRPGISQAVSLRARGDDL